MSHLNLLAKLESTPEQIAPLSYNAVRHVVGFLLRWQSWDEALSVLAAWRLDDRVSVQELRAQALVGVGRASEAVALMQRRLAHKDRSNYARVLFGRVLIAAGQTTDAGTNAARITQASPDFGPGWGLLGDAYLAAGYVDRAAEAFRHYRTVSPSARPPLIGLARVALQAQDGVAADAFAVQAIEEGGIDEGPPADILRAALAIFAAVPDVVRHDEATSLLAQRFVTELEAARAVLYGSEPTRRGAQRAGLPATPRPARAADAFPEPPPLSAAGDSPASPAEQARLTAAVQRLFGFDALLPWQPEILAAVGRGEDVLAILPTGGGKSLCYQLPAFMDGELGNQQLTIVVSPLIALMADQLNNLPPALRADTVAINSSMEAGGAAEAWNAIQRGRYRLIYLAPERLRQWPVIEALRARGVARLVVDEAHCVSSWGHNFRPDYLNLAQAHRDLGAPPILALTATAPTRVRQDIAQQLFGGSATRRLHMISADSFRPNLHLNAFKAENEDEKRDWLLSFCKELQGSGIVYARTRRNCEELAVQLQALGIAADAYHAGLGDVERSRIQAGFMAGRTRVLVATVAFGMGVDKPDIRFILHYGLPSSLEAYYQEAGRAGRDGLPAHCVLLHSTSDKGAMSRLLNSNAITVDFLRAVYRNVREQMRPWNPGSVALDALVHSLQDASDTSVRVALSILESAGLLRRHYDAPRRIQIELVRAPSDPTLASFAQAAGLGIGSAAAGDYLEICAHTGMDATVLERDLLAWQRAGLLRLGSSGRDALITLVNPPPADAEARVAALIDRLAAIQAQQISEIAAYARTRRCRHGYLSAYLGGAARQRCNACDNCNAGDLPAIESQTPDDSTQRIEVLRTVRERSLGMVNLTKVLAGDLTARPEFQALATFGKLNYRSRTAIEHLVTRMVDDGLLERKYFSETAYAFQLTANGTRLLRDAR